MGSLGLMQKLKLAMYNLKITHSVVNISRITWMPMDKMTNTSMMHNLMITKVGNRSMTRRKKKKERLQGVRTTKRGLTLWILLEVEYRVALMVPIIREGHQLPLIEVII